MLLRWALNVLTSRLFRGLSEGVTENIENKTADPIYELLAGITVCDGHVLRSKRWHVKIGVDYFTHDLLTKQSINA